MSVLRADSFGHYNIVLSKWDANTDGQIDLPFANARTNTGVCQIVGGVNGPAWVLGASFTQLIGQVAVNANTPGSSQNPTVMQFQIAGVGYNIAVRVNGDNSVSVWRGPGDTAEVELGRSTVRPFVWNTWNAIECHALFSATVGTVVVKVNGRQVISLSGIRTVAFAASQFSDAFRLFGPGSGLWYLADAVVIDPLVSPVTTFLNCAKVYVEVPTADSSVQWTPLGGGTNFSEVDEIPPDGDTSYNSSSTIGQVDQYVYGLTGVPSTTVIEWIQHNQDMRIDSGARTVASVLNGSVGDAFALTTSYLQYKAQWPGPFAQGSFPLNFGPKVTA